jgi:ArsR family transcriptional regulator
MPTPHSPFPKEVYERNAEIYKLMANPKRLEILNILKNGQATLSQLVEIVRAPKPNISQHLAILSHLRLIHRTKRNREAYYKIVNPKIVEACKILKMIWDTK